MRTWVIFFLCMVPAVSSWFEYGSGSFFFASSIFWILLLSTKAQPPAIALPFWLQINWAFSLVIRWRTKFEMWSPLCKNLLKAQPTWLIAVCTASAWPWSSWSGHQIISTSTFQTTQLFDLKTSPALTSTPGSFLLTCSKVLLNLSPFFLTSVMASFRKISVFSIVVVQGMMCTPIMSKKIVFCNTNFVNLHKAPPLSFTANNAVLSCRLQGMHSIAIDIIIFFISWILVHMELLLISIQLE